MIACNVTWSNNYCKVRKKKKRGILKWIKDVVTFKNVEYVCKLDVTEICVETGSMSKEQYDAKCSGFERKEE